MDDNRRHGIALSPGVQLWFKLRLGVSVYARFFTGVRMNGDCGMCNMRQSKE